MNAGNSPRFAASRMGENETEKGFRVAARGPFTNSTAANAGDLTSRSGTAAIRPLQQEH